MNTFYSLFKNSLKLSIQFLLIAICTTALAENTPQSTTDNWTFTSEVDETRENVGHFVTKIAEGLDHFLIGKKLTRKKNNTQLTLENGVIFKEGSPAEYNLNFNLDLKLPNLEKYWELKFTSYDNQERQRGVQRNYLGQPPKKKKYTAGFSFFNFLQALQPIRFDYRPQIYLEDPLNISHSFIFRSTATKKNWTFDPVFEFFANPEKATGVFLGLNLTYEFNKTNSITFINEGEYQEKENVFTATQGYAFGHNLSDTISLSFSNIFVTQTTGSYHLTSFSTAFGYNQLLIKDVLDLQIVPGLLFTKDYGFKGQAITSLNLNLTF